MSQEATNCRYPVALSLVLYGGVAPVLSTWRLRTQTRLYVLEVDLWGGGWTLLLTRAYQQVLSRHGNITFWQLDTNTIIVYSATIDHLLIAITVEAMGNICFAINPCYCSSFIALSNENLCNYLCCSNIINSAGSIQLSPHCYRKKKILILLYKICDNSNAFVAFLYETKRFQEKSKI
jgi:hypothetical protein